ncbi:uncharacterized protein LOC129728971 [Wyeomyia smithii]|uniref:uncharacterized protein LOC129728971 n=1 Tax=Wyeomyia smithii TaxID=174621 RepID=UPI00246817BB|nr:uncharacterized protein LOC129728971 [Wyeomyia smithii]
MSTGRNARTENDRAEENPAIDAARAPPSNFVIDPFNKKKLKWTRWVKRLENVFSIYGVADEIMRKSLLLHYMSAETYDIVCDKIAPVTPREKSYAEIVDVLEGFFNPQPLEISENFRFKCHQKGDENAASPNETVDEYLVALRRIAVTCNFGAYLERALRNQLVFGIKRNDIRSRLLEKSQLTLQNARDIARPGLVDRLRERNNIRFEVDTGSPVTIVSTNYRDKYFPNAQLRSCNTNLVSYCGTSIDVLGILDASVKYGKESVTLPLYVVHSGTNPLLGREWLNALPVNWNNVFKNPGAVNEITNATPTHKVALEGLLAKFPKVFDESIGKICNVQARLTLKNNARPVLLKARKIPFNLQKTVEEELDKLEAEGVLTKVNQSNWATPIVPVKKSQGRVRICANRRQTSTYYGG